jgi:hypothetical protein
MQGSISIGFVVHDKKGMVNKLKEKLKNKILFFLHQDHSQRELIPRLLFF